MAGCWLRRGVVLIMLAMLLATAGSMRAQAQGADDLAALRDQVSRLHSQGKSDEAIPIAERYVALAREKHGEEDTEFALAITWLARLYRAQGRYAEAEPIFKRALAITEKALGPDDPVVGIRLNNLARLYEAQGRVKEAEPLYRRALAISVKALGPDHPDVAGVRTNLGGLYKSLGRRAEAEPLLKSALATKEKVFGPGHPSVAYILTQLGDLYRLQGQCEQAEPLFVRALAISKGDIQEVPVLFGTDRKRDSSQPSVAFSGERAQGLSLGLAIATVPKEQTKGPVMPQARGPKGGAASEPASERRLALRCIEVVKDKQLIEVAVRRLAVSKNFPNQVFVFVHGYNVSFDNAVRRAAQIAYDLKFDGGTFLFSWPSRGQLNVRAYFSDRDTVDITAEHLRQFLEKVVAETKAEKVHFIAHSMGNLVLLRALEKIGSEAPALRPVIGEIIQAAPDVDTDVFKQMVERIKVRGANLTLYASASDKALWFSGWLRKGTRAGFISEKQPLIVAGVDTIDITRAGTGLFGLNHDVYSASPSIVADMRRIFEHSVRPPDKRTKEFEPVVSKEGTYWRLRPPQAGAQ
jgi:esterase/lipase superfamily enzyme